ncbi:MAG TPA: hypothetical protein ENI23_03695, partial [bacterium]|nr:hypothetical protein [bacterium]
MPVRSDTYYGIETFNDPDSTVLENHIPNVGVGWNKVSGVTLTIQNNTLLVPGNTFARYHFITNSVDAQYIEKVLIFTNTGEFSGGYIEFGTQGFSGSNKWLARWHLFSGNISLVVENGLLCGIWKTANIGRVDTGTHEIRLIGQEGTVTAYFDGKGIRINNIDSGCRNYHTCSFLISTEIDKPINITTIWGRNLIEPICGLDFTGGFSGGCIVPLEIFGGGGGSGGNGSGGNGSGGSGGGGGSADIPCDPSGTLEVVNGEVVTIGPENPCPWTGTVWWCFADDSVLTSPDYAVEADVFFNTLTDPDMGIGVTARMNETTKGHYYCMVNADSKMVIGKKEAEGQSDILLGSSPVSLIPGTWYIIRLEVQGNVLRGYLNDVLMVEATDPQSSFGGIGCAGVRLSRADPNTDL